MIAGGELPQRFALQFLRRLCCQVAFGFRGRESFWSQKPPPSFLCLCLSFSVFPLCPSLACHYLLEALCAIERTQLHRCVAWLAVCSVCLEQPPPPGPPALMKSCRGSIWQLLIRCGGSCPQTPSPLSFPPTTSLILSAPLKQGKLPGGGIHHGFGPGRCV